MKFLDEPWLKELNKRNLVLQVEDSSTWNFATATLFPSVLVQLSQEEQANFQITEFKRVTNEIENWARVEKICDFLELKIRILLKIFM